MASPEAPESEPAVHVMHLVGSGIPQPTTDYVESGRGITYPVPAERPGAEEIVVVTESLAAIKAKGPEYAQLIANRVLWMLGTEVCPIAGVAESASILDVSKQRVHQLGQKGVMPAVLRQLAATPIWRTADVIRFALLRGPTTGRPKANKPPKPSKPSQLELF